MRKTAIKVGKMIIAVCITAGMLLSGSGISAMAETTDTNEVKELPKDPVHTCSDSDSTLDKTEWSYIYFGSYPQSEITGEALTEDIINAEFDAYGDAVVDGAKYRRCSIEDVPNDYNFGDAQYRYFKWEKIKWRVLKNEGETLFVVADKGLDSKQYDEQFTKTTWEYSQLRKWLKNTFINMAFTTDEQSAIASYRVENINYASDGTLDSDVHDTTDKIYVLAREEIGNVDYGFCGHATRRFAISDYAYALGGFFDNNLYYGNTMWWLRSSGISRSYASYIDPSGQMDSTEVIDNKTVIPVMHVSVDSELWSMTNEETGVEGNGSGNEGTGGEGSGSGNEETGGESGGSGDEGTGGESGGSGNENTGGEGSGSGNENTENENNSGNTNTGNNNQQTGNGNHTNVNTNTNNNSNVNTIGKVQKITLSVSSSTVIAGKKVTIKAEVYPQTALNKNIHWYSGNTKRATVNSNGVVTTKKAGAGKPVYIIARAADGSGASAAIRLDLINGYVTKVKIKNAPKTLKAGQSVQLKTTVKYKGSKVNTSLTWKTSNKKYAVVNSKGKVTAKKAGKGKIVTITATATDGSKKKAKVRIRIK